MTVALVDIRTLQIVSQSASLPALFVWPNGDASHCPVLGDERSGVRLVSLIYGPDAPGEFYHETAVAPALSASVLTLTRTWQANDLAAVRAILSDRIDAAAEDRRNHHLTPGAGQALTYWQKAAEAKKFAADPAPVEDNYPLLSASVVSGSTLADTARIVSRAAREWNATAAGIERVRLQTKASIAAAATVDELAQIAASVRWP